MVLIPFIKMFLILQQRVSNELVCATRLPIRRLRSVHDIDSVIRRRHDVDLILLDVTKLRGKRALHYVMRGRLLVTWSKGLGHDVQ
jgi:hypothetical protein